jgi:hypothetical protein
MQSARCVPYRRRPQRWRAPDGVPTILTVFSVFGLGACGGGNSDLPSDLVGTSPHFDYRSRQGDDGTCPDVLGPLEEHFATLRGYIGFDWPAGRKITYLKFRDGDDFDAVSACPVGSAACTIGSTVESVDGFNEHELIHAYLFPTGYPPSVFVEGIAVALSCQTRMFTNSNKPFFTADQLAALDPSLNGGLVYEAGAWLVGYILEAFGPKAFLSLYGSLSHDATSAEVDAVFQRIFGQNLAQVWSSALAEDRPRSSCVWECSRPPLVLDGPAVDTTGTCGLGSVAHPFTLSSDATIAFISTAAEVTVGPCGRITPPSDYVPGANGAIDLYHLPADAYFLEHHLIPGTIVGKGDASGALTQDCALATDSALLNQSHVVVTVPQSGAPWFLALPHPTAETLEVLTNHWPNEGAALCMTCDASSCVDASQPIAWTGDDVLMLTTNPGAPFNEFSPVLR